MLIPLKPILEKYKLKINSVCHAGAHWAEEEGYYLDCGIKKRIYIEPCADAFGRLLEMFKGNPDVTLINCACGEFTGVQEINVSPQNQGQSNSLLTPLLHLQQHPEVKFTEKELITVRRLDDLTFNRENGSLLMMDCQGYEGFVLRGGMETLKYMDVVYTEVNRDQVYAGNTLISEMDEILKGYTRVAVEWVGNWGDAIYLRK